MAKAVAKNDFYFHLAHGVCRVADITRRPDTKELEYALLPTTNNKGKIRFVVPESALEDSGFSKLISSQSGQAILKYLKTGKEKGFEECQTWRLAKLLRETSTTKDKDSVKDTLKRQQIDQAVKGLAGELAFVLEMTPREAAQSMQDNLNGCSKMNAAVVSSFAKAEKEHS